ncbi:MULTISPECIES: hypothetical protein [Flavobacterium]|uniref:hypothetical protein n=1 Tax=Flavobacterium TaxID=237 RepID=UPI000F7AC7A9|nr:MULTISPECIES: hypothetical protein [Flavobacterium]MDP5200232.1 hypothetical protein [Flavobacterium sp. DG2-3]
MSLPKDLQNEKFAQYMESITVFYLADDRFKMICDEYCSIKENVRKIKKKIDEDFSSRVENENLSAELEEEILIYILNRME